MPRVRALAASRYDQLGTGFPQIPDVLTRTASSNRIQAGDTFVLNGILRQTNLDKMKLGGFRTLRDTPGIPIVGSFEAQIDRSRNQAHELLVFITPRLTTSSSPVGLPTVKQLWERRKRKPGTPDGVPQPVTDPAGGGAGA